MGETNAGDRPGGDGAPAADVPTPPSVTDVLTEDAVAAALDALPLTDSDLSGFLGPDLPTATEAISVPDEQLARVAAAYRAALNCDDPEASHRWLAMADWLAARLSLPVPRAGGPARAGERRRFPRVPVRSSAMLTVEPILIGDGGFTDVEVLTAFTVNLSHSGAWIELATDGASPKEGASVILSVAGWVEDRPARVVSRQGPTVRLVYR